MASHKNKLMQTAACLYVLLLAVGSLLPSGRNTPLAGWDSALTPTLQNALHVPAYAVLVALTAAALPAGRRRVGMLAAVAVAAVVYGLLLEWAQSAVPGRTGSLMDALLNAAGATAGAAACLAAWRRPKARPLGPGRGAEPAK